MRNACLFLSLVAAGMWSGCGVAVHTSAVPASSPLHGGILIPLPEDQGFVEILNDQRVRKGNRIATTIVAYLLQPDQKSPITQSSASVTVKLGTPPDVRTIKMRPEPGGSDPSGSARFVSELGPFLLEQSGGEVEVVLGGKTLTAPFRGPR
jgi:hypothetical protein